MYPQEITKPMEEHLTNKGIIALHTPEAVEEAVNKEGTVLIVVNSVCGCAYSARPGVLFALQENEGEGPTPTHTYTVFAGVDTEAVNKARSYFEGKTPSSPAIALLKNKKLVHMMERQDIMGKGPETIAEELKKAFKEHC
jgi:putative YphP/YqiW family bacilliredoxin